MGDTLLASGPSAPHRAELTESFNKSEERERERRARGVKYVLQEHQKDVGRGCKASLDSAASL